MVAAAGRGPDSVPDAESRRLGCWAADALLAGSGACWLPPEVVERRGVGLEVRANGAFWTD